MIPLQKSLINCVLNIKNKCSENHKVDVLKQINSLCCEPMIFLFIHFLQKGNVVSTKPYGVATGV